MLTPSPSQREAVALFRLSIIGDLLARDLAPGELAHELQRRAQTRYRPPGAAATRTYHWKTLQRWFYAARQGAGRLEPASRKTGHGRALSDAQRQLLLAMRRDHPSAPAEMLLTEAVRHGRLEEGQVSVSTLRRLFRDAGLDRKSRRRATRADVQRRRWQAAQVADLWHADVCHLMLTHPDGRPRRVYVHGFFDDNSRYFTALMARATEQATDMLSVLCGALLRYPAPRTLYLDNGACYRSQSLALFCKRLDIQLIHATPYNPQARGKMERVWRTLRQRCTDHLPASATIHDINQALWAWLDADYHRRPHSALMAKTPRAVFRAGLGRLAAPHTPRRLAEALETTAHRTVRADCTFTVAGAVYEVVGAHLARRRIAVVLDGLTGKPLRATWKETPVRFGACNPRANRHRERGVTPPQAPSSAPFDPIAALLEKARGVGDE